MKVLITGGSGFVGVRTAERLLTQSPDCTVTILDLQPPVLPPTPRLHFIQGSLSDTAVLAEAVPSHDVVLHLASYGMSGSAMLRRRRVRQVNVLGTALLLSACRDAKVKGFVYVSSYNAAFGNKEIVNGDVDKVPYFPSHLHVDEYSRSKGEAEQLVIAADNALGLRTCAVRPAAIYGEGEQRHFPRILDLFKRFPFLAYIGFGKPTDKVDWVHVDNLAEVLVLAITKIVSPETSEKIGGQVFISNDDYPINQFEFLAKTLPPCSKGAKIWIPTWIMLWFGFLLEFLFLFARVVFFGPMNDDGVPFEPTLPLRAEVLKVAVTHYFSMEKTYRLLGYKPVWRAEEAMERVYKYYSDISSKK